MAGEIEESFSMNFQADSIHSGSISFGRFESEPLSWERRSSFSHNRYMEEVEKFSTPGSVIKRKEYFEAHFKKKGLFGIIPSTCHDRLDRATGDNDGSERICNQQDFESNDDLYIQSDQRPQEDFEPNKDENYVQIEKRFQDDFEPNEDDYYIQFDQGSQEDFDLDEGDHCVKMDQGSRENFVSNEDGHYVQYDQRSRDDFELDEGGHYVKIDQRSQEEFEPNEYDHYAQFGEIHFDSDYYGECGVNGYEREDSITEFPMVSFSSSQMKSAMNCSNKLEDVTKKSITLDEAQQSENETRIILSANDNTVTEVKNDDDNTVNTDESSTNKCISVKEPAQGVDETISHDPTNPSPKLQPQMNSEVNNVHARKTSSSKSSKGPARNPNRESPRRMNMENSSSKPATPTSSSASKTAKEVSKTVEKPIRESKSENVSRMKKATESQPSVLKTASKGIQRAERLNQAFNSTKSNVRPRAEAFNFKSSERAERRKEFYLNLQEKEHAKEVEMNQMQAISQEQREADIKKLRKSLKFKATPMPSFYRTTLPPQSHGNKVVSHNTRSKKTQNKPKCPGSDADLTLPVKLKLGNDQAADESVTATKPRSISIEECAETSLISPAPSTSNSSCLANFATSNHILPGKKDQAMLASRSANHRVVSDSGKGARKQTSEGNKSGETPKHRNDIMKKGVRNIGFRSSSKSGNLTVRVAS